MWGCEPYVIILLIKGEAKKQGYRKGKEKKERREKEKFF